jgi:hypothetical protein
MSLHRFFQKMRVDRPVLRNNFFFQIIEDCPEKTQGDLVDPEELAWSDTTNGPEGTIQESKNGLLTSSTIQKTPGIIVISAPMSQRKTWQ